MPTASLEYSTNEHLKEVVVVIVLRKKNTKPSTRARAHAVPMRPNQGGGLEARRNLDQKTSVFEALAEFRRFPKF
jgi:hypothetical protein